METSSDNETVGVNTLESGVSSNDFSVDVVYTVTAGDGSTQDYTIWVFETVDRTQLDAKVNAASDLSRLDVSGISNMNRVFSDKFTFNGDISRWDVSSVTTMSAMFHNAHTFNCDISAWNVSFVTDYSYFDTRRRMEINQRPQWP